MKIQIIGVMNVFNEADILEENLECLHEQGVKLVVVDNGSTDGSYEIAQRFLNKNILKLESLKTDKFSINTLLKRDFKLLREFDLDWVLWVDADEFVESPFRNLTLKEAVEKEADKGYNVIQFNNFQFWPSERDRKNETSVRAKLRFYSWINDYHFKCWKWYPGSWYDMHRPRFPSGIEEKISPTKFVMRHYIFRSYQHGLRKVYEERLKRYDPEEKSKGMGNHYDDMTRGRNYFVADSINLTEYREDGVWNLEPKFHMSLYIENRLAALKAYMKNQSYFPSEPLEKLLRIYETRPDLQKAFPDVAFGKYDSLIDWASRVVLGKFPDSDRTTLLNYSAWYIANNAKKLREENEQMQRELQKKSNQPR